MTIKFPRKRLRSFVDHTAKLIPSPRAVSASWDLGLLELEAS